MRPLGQVESSPFNPPAIVPQLVDEDRVCVNKGTFAVGSAAVIFVGLGLVFATIGLLRSSR